MAIRWKKRFRPGVVLGRIDASRTVTPDGRASFSGSVVHEHISVLWSMLEFPDVAARLNKPSLIWAGLAQAKGKISPASFLEAINLSLRKELSTGISEYVLSSSLSIDQGGLPSSIKVLGVTITFHPNGLPRRYSGSRAKMKEQDLPISSTPSTYLPVTIRVRDTSSSSAALHAIDRLDLLRGLLAVHTNLAMQISFTGQTPSEPINMVRCGGVHMIHNTLGDLASETVWFEPNFRPAKLHALKRAGQVLRVVKIALKRIASATYERQLTEAIVRAARALDEPDPNTAFLKLWAALESLMTPNHADYDALVRRCAFLFEETDYHAQVLEHLREYRNRSVHSGVEAGDARVNCFLLQTYFRGAVNFYIGHALTFKSLTEAHEFLDLPTDRGLLAGKIKTLRRALRFVGPHDGEA